MEITEIILKELYQDHIFKQEFNNYAKAKKSLQGKLKENCPKTCLRDFERREKIIKDFENKYLK